MLQSLDFPERGGRIFIVKSPKSYTCVCARGKGEEQRRGDVFSQKTF